MPSSSYDDDLARVDGVVSRWWSNMMMRMVVAGDDDNNSNVSTVHRQATIAVFYVLAAIYACIAAVALAQLMRIQMRVPEYGWTTQKVFHLLNFLFCFLRCVTFAARAPLEHAAAAGFPVVKAIFMDLPTLMFFTTYALLVLFWAEIYHQARSMPTAALRPAFLLSNAVIYFLQIGIWVYLAIISATASGGASAREILTCNIVTSFFMMVVSIASAFGFLMYGGRLYMMLTRFPIESKGRRRKLKEVGLVSGICMTCFVIRAVMVAVSAISEIKSLDSEDGKSSGDEGFASLDMLGHPALNFFYYLLVEVLPAALVLFILRRLPPARRSFDSYERIGSGGSGTGEDVA
mmetsp:Transcript_15153/g.40064  ORF Transcript_15153/g.40064 Transcript_15153/m.40064 type:complete len:348 (-) Transcript_15153:145-1188(-)